MKRLICTAALIGSLVTSFGCETYVQNIEPPIDTIDDAALNSETQVPFLINGIRETFSYTYGNLTMLAGGLSDELEFNRLVPGATFPQYEEIDLGRIQINNNSVEDLMLALGQLRLYADTLVARTGVIAFSSQQTKKTALYAGYFYGGMARFFWASYFGLEPLRGGGVINKSPFIPSHEMYELALERFQLALDNAPSDYDTRVVNSMIARILLIEGRYAEAETASQAGLLQSDPAFTALYSVEDPNPWFYGAGMGRTQFVAANRFGVYVQTDPGEAVRVPLLDILGQDGTTHFLRQNKYPEQETPIPLTSWQEMELLRAETAVRNNRMQDALSSVNIVRSSYGLGPRNSCDLDTVMTERDIELFGTGMRLIDQRRTDHWHLQADTWHFLPITQRERTSNPYL